MGADALLEVQPQEIALAPHVWVDWHEITRLAGLRAARAGVADPALKALLHNGDLLEGWPDTWCTSEREQLRNLRRDVLARATDQDRRQLPQHGFRSHLLHRVSDSSSP